MSKIRIGVVGVGGIGKVHLQGYQENPTFEVVALADPNAERVAQVAQDYSIDRSHTDPAQLFADDQIDAVSICTPNDSHAALAIQAIEAGKHVLVEKPMSRTYSEAAELQRVAEASDRVLLVGFVRRYATNAQVLKSFINAGELGDIYYASAAVIRRMGNPGGWFANKAISGGGPVVDIGVHVIDLAWYLMGSPKVTTVSANTYERLGDRANITTRNRYLAADPGAQPSDVEDMANALIRFDNGASMMVEASYSLHATEDRLQVSVYGEKGGAETEPLRIATERHGSILNITPVLSQAAFDFKVGFAHELAHFAAAIRGEEQPIAPAAHGAEIAKILDLIYESAATGREIDSAAAPN